MNGKVPGARLWGRDWRSELRAQNQWKASLGRRIWRRSTKIQQSLLSPVLTYQIPVVVALVVAVHHHRRQFPAAPSFRLNPKNPLHRRDQRRERGDSLQFGEIERDTDILVLLVLGNFYGTSQWFGLTSFILLYFNFNTQHKYHIDVC